MHAKEDVLKTRPLLHFFGFIWNVFEILSAKLMPCTIYFILICFPFSF